MMANSFCYKYNQKRIYSLDGGLWHVILVSTERTTTEGFFACDIDFHDVRIVPSTKMIKMFHFSRKKDSLQDMYRNYKYV